MLTQERVKELFDYRGDGVLIWKKNSIRKTKLKPAGYTDNYGYKIVGIDNKRYKAHRVIWLMFNGKIDKNKHIDHINHDKLDNMIENLREVTHQENQQNRPPRKGSIYRDKRVVP